MPSNELSKHPICLLAEQVQSGHLSLAQAWEQVAAEKVLAQVDEATLCKLNQRAYGLGRQNPPQAIALAELLCRAAKLKGSPAVQGDCNSTLGWLYLRQDRLDRALDCYQEALELLQPMPEGQAAVARIRLEVGEVRMQQGDLAAAAAEYEAVLVLARQLECPDLESDAQNGLGDVYLVQGQADAALDAFRDALEIGEKSQDPYGQRDALGNLGRACRFLGHLSEAIGHHQRAVKISRTLDHQAGLGRHLGLLGSALMEKGELDKAEAFFQEALSIACRRGDRASEQLRLGSLGNLYQARGERGLAQARQYHQNALDIARERNDRRGQAHHLLNLGHVYGKLERPEKAQECLGEALRLAQEQNASNTQWRVHYAWGNLCAAQGQEKQAFDHYEAAIKIVETQRSQIIVESRTKFWQERAVLYKRMVLCCLRLGKLWPALVYTERAKTRYLSDLLHAPGAGDTRKTVRAVLKDLPPRTATVVFNVTGSGTVVFVVAKRDGLLRRLSAVLRRAFGRKISGGWQRSFDGHIQARLIERFGQGDLQRILVERDAAGEIVGGYLFDYVKNFARWFDSTLEATCDAVYEALLDPVCCELVRLRVKRVVLMPNLGLSLLPLHACRFNGAKRDRVLDRYEIVYAPSFDVLDHCQRRVLARPRDGSSLFAVANPERADPHKNLVWADMEVERIAELFPEDRVRILDNGGRERATQDAVVARASGYACVHFACHGKFDLREPLWSALSLTSPEKLTLDTVFRRLRLSNTRLVVMSACETGLVDPGDLADEYVGLPAGFVRAGAPAVVASLWAVDDLSTALLMERFYRCYLQGDPDRPGEGPLLLASALRRAQQWLRDTVTARMAAEVCQQWVAVLKAQADPAYTHALDRQIAYKLMDPDRRPFKHPYFWAPFTITGW